MGGGGTGAPTIARSNWVRFRKFRYRESQLFAGLFGNPKEYLPQDWTGFAD
jgi:hypothetical protein